MKFQARLTIALLALAAVPLAIFGYGVRREMIARLDTDAARRVGAVQAAASARMSERISAAQARLTSLAQELANDNRFRLAISGATAERRWLIDWAPARINQIGFAVLWVQDSVGRVLSSGQFRNDFDRIAPALPGVIDARTPEGTVRAFVNAAPFAVRGLRFYVTGGAAFDSASVAALSPDAAVSAVLAIGEAPPPDRVVVAATFPYVNETEGTAVQPARLLLLPDPGPALALKADFLRWLLLTLGGTLLTAIIVAALLGGVISAPVVELARRAERLAATSDLARQVNHDIKNGLAPIRNVLRHLSQTAEREPATLATIYAERRDTLDSSVEYLDGLARNYAKLSPVLSHGPTDVRAVVLDVARGVSGVRVELRLPDSMPAVRVDAVVLRRIVDNIVSNAVDSLEGKPGTITLGAEAASTGVERRVRITVADTGRGMSREELALAFDDFYTTKPAGTGLGLTVVRRLLTDVGGSVRAESAPGKGSTFTVELPLFQPS